MKDLNQVYDVYIFIDQLKNKGCITPEDKVLMNELK